MVEKIRTQAFSFLCRTVNFIIKLASTALERKLPILEVYLRWIYKGGLT